MASGSRLVTLVVYIATSGKLATFFGQSVDRKLVTTSLGKIRPPA